MNVYTAVILNDGEIFILGSYISYERAKTAARRYVMELDCETQIPSLDLLEVDAISDLQKLDDEVAFAIEASVVDTLLNT